MEEVEMRATAAGPAGVFRQGERYPLNETTRIYVKQGYAEVVDGIVESPEAERDQNVETPEAPQQTKEEVYPKALDGGWWELSNGEKVRGKQAAIEAEHELSG